MLKVEHISSGYNKKQVLFDISFEILRGSFTVIAGPNGSGKSTLFKTIYGIIKPWEITGISDPHIWFDGKEITKDPSYSFIRKGMMYVPQKDNYFPNLDVSTNLQVSGTTISNSNSFANRLDEVYSIFPILKKYRYQNLMELSGGEKQMAILAMALIHRPKLILLDEPTLNLSPAYRTILLDKLREFNKSEKITILMVEHKVKECLNYADHLIGIKFGKVYGIYDITPSFKTSIIKDILI